MNKQHGGARPNAGRKAKRGNTKVMRIPTRFENAVTQLIEHLSKQSEAGVPELETEVFMRDLLERPVELVIKTHLRNLK